MQFGTTTHFSEALVVNTLCLLWVLFDFSKTQPDLAGAGGAGIFTTADRGVFEPL